jgi:hypothetical protein
MHLFYLSILSLIQLLLVGLWQYFASQSHLEVVKFIIGAVFCLVTLFYFYKIRNTPHLFFHLFFTSGWIGFLVFIYVGFTSKPSSGVLNLWEVEKIFGYFLLFFSCGTVGVLTAMAFKLFTIIKNKKMEELNKANQLK